MLRGGRVLDPETGLDAVRHVGIADGRITVVSDELPESDVVLDVTGQVVAPGFIDLHSHAQSVTGLRLQALDGVTTALELEAGVAPFTRTRETATEEGRPINFGYSASWALARMQMLAHVRLDGAEDPITTTVRLMGDSRWRRPATPAEVEAILDLLEEEVAAGALGIGVLLGYAPESGRSEYVRIAALAEHLGVPTFTHSRFISRREPHTSLEGAAEVLAAAAGTGAHMHLCHLNSTSNWMIDQIAQMVATAQRLGVRLTTEAYPYGSAATGIGAAFLDPDKLDRIGITPTDIVFLPTGERVADADRLLELREQDPGGLVVYDWLNEADERQRAVLERSLLLTDTAIASDATPLVNAADPNLHDRWPVPPHTVTHPRTAGCYGKLLRWAVRETRILSLAEAVRRCTIVPAQVLEQVAPSMACKGRVQVGADADLAIFDPATVSDRSTYHDSARPSAGFRHVLVGGTFVVRDGQLLPDRRPGRCVHSKFI
ncbi:amidohydrolase family protein [Amycolatopsis sp. EV170708-02-1]|nr:amidohydrolase family protein [Amycolatopsis sp. EV170708-02-1]UMP00057.1 amidohydrolase family protein [Amycolatopsis sp. EV170708-02-1]